MDDNWLSGGCQILRFPGFEPRPQASLQGLHGALQQRRDGQAFAGACWRTLNWYKQTHNPKGADYRTFYLSMNDKQIGRGGSAA